MFIILLAARILLLFAMVVLTIRAFRAVYIITYKNELSPIMVESPKMKPSITNSRRTNNTYRKTAPAKKSEFQKIENKNSKEKRASQKTVSYREYRSSASK